MIQASKQHPEKFLNKTLNLFQWCTEAAHEKQKDSFR